MLKKVFIAICAAAALIACSPKDDPSTLRVGVIAGPEAELMEAAKKVAKRDYDLNIRIVEFEDYTLPNIALNDGALDANLFQTQVYLDSYVQTRGQDLVAVGKVFIYPVGAYSAKHKTVDALPDKAKVAIPNDPSNGARALILMHKSGLIVLKDPDDTAATRYDIIDNPKELQLIELDAAQLPRSMPDVDLAIINTNYSISAGLLPTRDALIVEDADSPYANVVVVRRDNIGDDRVAKLIDALQSDEVKAKADELFQGQAVPAW
jgi:D-methionine transport system substrate-binding protein